MEELGGWYTLDLAGGSYSRKATRSMPAPRTGWSRVRPARLKRETRNSQAVYIIDVSMYMYL